MLNLNLIWEYRLIHSYFVDEAEQKLNDAAAEGWCLNYIQERQREVFMVLSRVKGAQDGDVAD